eukprot:TRINITY_DN25984_c0_g1_i1.p1 TRINITY_DN25984_c0_g1~~TRINITY_DN25984_c0_g1_i1.p1  ORF type:complete len:1278 (+),score=248.90 TRINITY_DN25984_c0_g1_i1:26-3859(+)
MAPATELVPCRRCLGDRKTECWCEGMQSGCISCSGSGLCICSHCHGSGTEAAAASKPRAGGGAAAEALAPSRQESGDEALTRPGSDVSQEAPLRRRAPASSEAVSRVDLRVADLALQHSDEQQSSSSSLEMLQQDIGLAAAGALALKGFAVLDTGLNEDHCTEAQADAGVLRGRLAIPPELLLDGLLGKRGSARFCMVPFHEPPSRRARLEALREINDLVGRVVTAAQPALSATCGVDVSDVMPCCLLHETGSWNGRAAPPLTETDVDFWLPQLTWHRLMAIVALGPSAAEVSLSCFPPDEPPRFAEAAAEGAEDAEEDGEGGEAAVARQPLSTEDFLRQLPTEVYRLKLQPGQLLLLRPDLMSHAVDGEAGDYTMSWWFQSCSRPTTASAVGSPLHGMGLIPAARKLDQWAVERIQSIGQMKTRWADENLELFRVVAPYAYKLDAPRRFPAVLPGMRAGQRLEVAEKGQILAGLVELVDGVRWLKCLTEVQDHDGQLKFGYVILDAELASVDRIIEKVTDLPMDWQIAFDHTYFTTGAEVAVRAAACKFTCTHEINEMGFPFGGGPDFAVPVKNSRWDHSEYWGGPDSEDPTKLMIRHGGFIDGLDLFDNKRFSIPPAEVISMDPNQRLLLECADEAYVRAGRDKNSLYRSVSGVYVGGGNPEWTFTPNCAKSPQADMYGCTGSSTAIHSNRISYNLGLMGPSITIISEGASSSIAIERGKVSLSRVKSDNVDAIALGASCMLTPLTWFPLVHLGVMWNGGLEGRCLTFEASASGYIRGEGCGAVVLEQDQELIDGELVRDPNKTTMGILRAASVVYNGCGAGLTSPSGPAQQILIHECLREAKVDAVSVDAVDCNAEGRTLFDAVEAVATSKAFRPDPGFDMSPLQMFSLKSSQTHCIEAAGICGFLRALLGSMTGGISPPMLHLHCINPMLEFNDDFTHCFATERIPARRLDSLVAIKGDSITGTKGIALLTGISDPAFVSNLHLKRKLRARPLCFWPAGGGELPPAALPRRGYELFGSMDGWKSTRQMEFEESGGPEEVYATEITIGVNGFEHFQILVDGNRDKVLHPSAPSCLHGPALGPTPGGSVERHLAWRLSSALPGSRTHERLAPGDRFRVELHVSGVWRAVSWTKLPASVPGASEVPLVADQGEYFAVADWNKWSASQAMQRGTEPGNYSCETKLVRQPGQFQIIRDGDWNQCFHPGRLQSPYSGGEAAGPDEPAPGNNWVIDGVAGDVFRIDFARSFTSDESSRVSWTFLRHEQLQSWEEFEAAHI